MRLFNHLLVEYPLRGQSHFEKVVPANMVVLTDQPIQASLSYNVSQEPAKPFWMLEYVSPHNPRKNYDDSFARYEHELKVPYLLSFFPDSHHLALDHHTGRKYVSVPPNAQGRYPIPELDLEVGLLDGWVRFWYQGELLPLPADLQRQADDAQRRANEEKRRADALAQQAATEVAARQAAERELAQLRARLEQLEGRPPDGAD